MSGGKSWLQWKEEGSESFRKEQWLAAMNCYTWAIRAKDDEAILYSNRAICEMKLHKFQLAREDAESAIRLDSKNVKFYRILSEALVKLQLHSEALKVCDQGLELDPREPDLLVRQQQCQRYISKQPPAPNGPKTDETDKQSGRKCDQLDTKKVEKDQPTPKPGELDNWPLDDLLQEKLLVTKTKTLLQCPRHDYVGALEFVQQMADNNFPIGLFHLGLYHHRGKAGFQVNRRKAVKLWKKAAGQKPFRKGSDGVERTAGVAEAENALGDAYRDGLGVKRDECEAFKWYKRSAEHGCPSSYPNIVKCLMHGRGCKVNMMAACDWFGVFCRYQANDAAPYGEEEWTQRCIGEHDDEDDDFENYFYDELFSGKYAGAFDRVDEEEGDENDFPPAGGPRPLKKCQYDREELLSVMAEKRRQGASSATSFFEALDKLKAARALLEAKQYDEAFSEIREISRTPWLLQDLAPFIETAKTLIGQDSNNHAALFTFCLYGRKQGDYKENLKRALRLVELDASNCDYQFLLSFALAENGETQKALEHCDRALELLVVPSWLYFRATLLQSLGLDKIRIEDMMDAYRRYVASVPADHADVAESYYAIGYLHSWTNDSAKAIALYRKGLEAEDVRLPCFANFDGFFTKRKLEVYFKDNGIWPLKQSNVVERMCSTCTTTQNLSSCSGCKAAWYCSRQCQKFNWMVHKRSCSK